MRTSLLSALFLLAACAPRGPYYPGDTGPYYNPPPPPPPGDSAPYVAPGDSTGYAADSSYADTFYGDSATLATPTRPHAPVRSAW